MKNRLWIVIVASVLFPAFVPGCGPSSVDMVLPLPSLLSLSVTPADPSIAPGTTTQFTAIGTFSDHSKRDITSSATWSSSDAGIAAVSNVPGSKGLATATLAGSAVITAASGSVTGSSTLTTSPVASIAVTPSTPPSIAPGTTQQFTASGTLADSTVQDLTTWATWTTSDTAIASVSNGAGSQGLATAVAAPGTATVGATYGGVTGSALLTTSPVASILVTPAAPSIPKGTSVQFAASGTLADSTVQDLTAWATWTSSNTGVATISNASGSNGLAASVAVGSTTITATFDAVTSTSATLTVSSAVLVSTSVTPTNPSIALGETQQFAAIGTFSDNTEQDISSSVAWHSSNTNVATISNTAGSKGLATSLAVGTTTITASFSGITSDTATLTVTPAALASIAVAPTAPIISVGTTQQFTATGIFTDGSSQNLTSSATWTSSNTSVATINNQGLATASFFVTGATIVTATSSGVLSNPAILTVQ